MAAADGWEEEAEAGAEEEAPDGTLADAEKGEKDSGITARYLLPDLPSGITEDDLRAYFGEFGDVEEATVKTLAQGTRFMGSVRFTEPTLDLRNVMLNRKHALQGVAVRVCTWKMLKMEKPGAAKGCSASKGCTKGAKGGKGVTYHKGPPRASAGTSTGPYGAYSGAKGGYDAHGDAKGAYGPHYADSGKAGKGAYGGYAASYYEPPGAYVYGYGKAGDAGKGWDGYSDYGNGKGSYGYAADYYSGYAWDGWEPAGPSYGKASAGKSYGYGASASSFPTELAKGRLYGKESEKGRDAPASYGKGKAFDGKAGGKGKLNDEITSRFLLNDLTAEVTEQDLTTYFSAIGDIEEITLKTLDNGRTIGSVKFHSPTVELRNLMLKERHEVQGILVTVQTHKMQKLSRPGGPPASLGGAPRGAGKGAKV
jgi:hypothetical protein